MGGVHREFSVAPAGVYDGHTFFQRPFPSLDVALNVVKREVWVVGETKLDPGRRGDFVTRCALVPYPKVFQVAPVVFRTTGVLEHRPLETREHVPPRPTLSHASRSPSQPGEVVSHALRLSKQVACRAKSAVR
jgi:hypothetical protein